MLLLLLLEISVEFIESKKVLKKLIIVCVVLVELKGVVGMILNEYILIDIFFL